MAGKKFSDFSTSAMGAATSFLVGYDTVADTNDRWDRTAVAGWLGPALTTLYAANGTIETTRIAKVTDTLTFQNLAGSSTLFSLNNDGTFTLGIGATSGGDRSVAIGRNATAYETGNEGSIAIGDGATTTDKYGTAIGSIGTSAAQRAIAISTSATATTEGSISIGYDADTTGTAGITLSSAVLNVANNVAYKFGVYMSSATDADFEVIGSGDSTLRTNLVVTGQACAGNKLTGITDLTFDWDNGNIQKTTMGASTPTFTASNPTLGATYILLLTQTGAVTATWTGVTWPAATAPTLSGNLKTDIITLICYDATGAGEYYGTSVLDYTT